ncbi:MAG: hypothetical protein WC047_05755 [Kiritimatiellales bacterium]
MTLAQAKDIAAIIGAIVGLAALLKGVIEYSCQGAQKRAEHFLTMRKRLKENTQFKEICALLETNDPALREIPFKEKRDFLGYFEEVAILMNSRLISKHVAHYMFAYYAIRCWESGNFWNSVNRNSIYWMVFGDFVERMNKLEKRFLFKRRHYRF